MSKKFTNKQHNRQHGEPAITCKNGCGTVGVAFLPFSISEVQVTGVVSTERTNELHTGTGNNIMQL